MFVFVDPLLILKERCPESFVLGYDGVVRKLQFNDILLVLVDEVIPFVFLFLDCAFLNDFHELLLRLGGQLHDAGNELGLEAALNADDKDQMQKGFESLLGFSLRHFDEVHVGKLLGKGHFAVLLQRRVQLLVYLFQNVVVVFPVRWVLWLRWGLKSLELREKVG